VDTDIDVDTSYLLIDRSLDIEIEMCSDTLLASQAADLADRSKYIEVDIDIDVDISTDG